MSDHEFRENWKYTHAQLLAWCKENVSHFKQDRIFNAAKKSIAGDINCVYDRKLDSTNSKSASQKFYTDLGLEKIRKYYEEYSTAGV